MYKWVAACLVVASLAGCAEPDHPAALNSKALDVAKTTQETVSMPSRTKAGHIQDTALREENGQAVIEEIGGQSFETEFEAWGKVRFVAAKRIEPSGFATLQLSVQGRNGNLLQAFPQTDLTQGRSLRTVTAVSFRDVDGNGQRDVIVLAEYEARPEAGEKRAAYVTIPSIYLQRGKRFVSDTQLEDRLVAAGHITTIMDVMAFLRSRQPNQAAGDARIPGGAAMPNQEKLRSLCLTARSGSYDESGIIDLYTEAYTGSNQDADWTFSEMDEDMMYGELGGCFREATEAATADDETLRTHAEGVADAVERILLAKSSIDYYYNGGGSMWMHMANRTHGIYGYRIYRYMKMKQQASGRETAKYDALAQELEADLRYWEGQSVDPVFTDSGIGYENKQPEYDDEVQALKVGVRSLRTLTAGKDKASIYLLNFLAKDLVEY
ncbi:hypothetical protein [Paenibacillus methanolicus]|uniref:Lipoprotein n=1 Tax=Paenibacillus methanolicus TaxID=582686 RepID=A0A5S5CH15_9BACL|nr:hypothetical protein [Paenibacillus methanolicus]TYP79050.1 hypothetical protein BCM02_101165 [Paenibacillus methanolicus]